MTELTQPLAAAPREAAARRLRRGRAANAPSFSELVYAHFDWWREREHDQLRPATAAVYQDALRRFQERHGEIVHAYWCTHEKSAVALTARRRRIPWATPRFGFHRESDWATRHHPDVACELHHCDELAVRARTVLTGVRQRICLQLVASAAGHLLSLVDVRAAEGHDAAADRALRQERAALENAEKYYRDAANGQAQMVYFVGMALATVAIAAVAAVWLAIAWASPMAALVAGAAGAVVSVIQRINAGKFTLDFDIGRPYAAFLGGLRPLIGGAFAMAISFAFTSGLLHLPLAANQPRTSSGVCREQSCG